MRLLPPPCEEMRHTAHAPPPFPCYPGIYFAPALAAAVAWPIGFLTRRVLKHSPLATAKLTTTLALLGTSLGTLNTIQAERDVRRTLEHHGLQVPKRRFADRWGRLDGENVLMIGGLVGVFVASRRPASWATTLAQRSTRYLAAFSYGVAFTAVGTLVVPPLHWYNEAASTWIHFARAAEGSQVAVLARKAGGHIVPTETRGMILPGVGEPDDTEALEKEWQHDPRPHASRAVLDENDQATRAFMPMRTLDHFFGQDEPDAEAQLKEHLELLCRQRKTLSDEAEAMWWRGSRAQAAVYEAASKSLGPPGDDGTHAEDVFTAWAAARVNEEMHLRLWNEISTLDWIIADTKRMMLQLEARRKGKTWAPQLSKPLGEVPLTNVRSFAFEQYVRLWADLKTASADLGRTLEAKELIESQLPQEVIDDVPGQNPLRAELDDIERELALIHSLAQGVGAFQKFFTEIGCPELIERLQPRMDLRDFDFRELSDG